MPRVISIANQKGGVGKTTTAVNLSSCMAVRGRVTLIVDMDPQGNTTTGLGVDKRKLERNIYHCIIRQSHIRDIILRTEVEKLYLAPANEDLFGADVELVDEEAREWRLAEALAPVKNEYDFIIIDCPPSLSLLTINALCASDTVLVPIQCEFYAMEGMSQLLKTIRLVRKRLNPDLMLEGFLLTMFDKRNNLSHRVAREVLEHFPQKVFRTVIPRNVRLSEAPSFGKPAILYDPTSTGSRSYESLASEILGYGGA